MTDSQNDTELNKILEGVINEYSAGAYFPESKPLMEFEAFDRLKALISQREREAKQNGKVNEANRNLMMTKRFAAQWRQGDNPDPELLLKDAGNRVMKLKRLATEPEKEE